MHALSNFALFILDRMEPDRRYEVLDLRAFVPDASAERVREVMHELWVARQVERAGYLGWQRRPSASPHQRPDTHIDPRQTKVVKPEDLFDHDSFTDFFR